MAKMAKKLYVGNLNYSTTDDQLNETFVQYGNVASAHIVYDRYSNQSKGFGFVEMESDSECSAAITSLNGADLNGRELRVSEARPRNDRNNSY
jgi:RNA recognition motif-containing protein